jgi:hypothetical protein
VLVRYSLWGKEQEYGLRLDLDKKIFLDHLPEPELDKIAQLLVIPIWEQIARTPRFALPPRQFT